MLSEGCSSEPEGARLRHLATPEGKKEYSEYIVRDGRGIAELLETFSSCSPSWATLLELCPKLSPR